MTTRNDSFRHCYWTGTATFAVLFALTSLFPVTGYGQQGDIEEIVVTARKREENLQDVPLAVSAFTEAALEERGIASLQDIADFTPGFDFASAFGRADFRPSIRGQSTILGRANAGLFVDGIIIEEGNATIPLSALERVEVIKGPQAALYGRSTLAGAVNYVLKKPSDSYRADVQLEYGDMNHVRAEAHARGPLSDTLGFAFTASHYQRDGTYDNRYPGNKLGTPATNDEVGGEQTTSLAAVLVLTPSEQLSLTGHAIYEDTNDDHYAIAMQPVSFNNCFKVTRGGSLTQPTPPAGTPEASASSVGTAGYNGSGYYCGRVDVAGVLDENDGNTRLETSFFDDMGVKAESLRLGLRLDFDLTDAFTFTSVTGYNQVDSDTAQDQTFGGGDTRYPVIGVGSPFRVQSVLPGAAPASVVSRVGFMTSEKDEFDDFSQELRLSYDAGDALRYTAGFYYYQSDAEDMVIASADTTKATAKDGTRVFVPFNPRSVPMMISTSAFYEGAPFRPDGMKEISSWAAFGSLEFDLAEKLGVGAEIRYNKDEFESTPSGANAMTYEGDFDNWLPKVTAKYQFTDQLLVYGYAAKGNKPGDINTAAGLSEADRLVDEETAWTYELGVKSSWMEDRLIANVAAYHIDWTDMQLTTTRAVTNAAGQSNAVSILVNAGEAHSTGVEIDLSMYPTDFWNVRVAYAWTDSEIDEFVQSVDAGVLAPSGFREAALINGYAANGDVVISGVQIPQSSKDQLSLSSTFSGNMMNGSWSWFLRGDFIYNSKRYAQVYNLAHTGSREIVNLRGGVSNGNIDVELWLDNALDDEASPALIRYVEAVDLTFNPFSRAIGVTLPEPQRFGITARYRFRSE